MVTKFDNLTLEEKINSGDPVVVDFWAEWCGPCRMLGPTIDQLGEEFTGKVSIGKLNIDDYQESAAKYGVRSIPTVLFFNKGELVEKFTGVAEKKVFRDKIEALISNN
ncbi:MAG: thioredoxin 1 [Flavobacteriales bacterium]|jgi:thioredoxin 1|tara:strand:- start:66 stop:389 length:324 start_codon:yes stop_codon:yes gene_type:complete